MRIASLLLPALPSASLFAVLLLALLSASLFAVFPLLIHTFLCYIRSCALSCCTRPYHIPRPSFPPSRQPLFHLPQHIIAFAEGETNITAPDMRVLPAVKCLRRETCNANFFDQVARTFHRRIVKNLQVIGHKKA